MLVKINNNYVLIIVSLTYKLKIFIFYFQLHWSSNLPPEWLWSEVWILSSVLLFKFKPGMKILAWIRFVLCFFFTSGLWNLRFLCFRNLTRLSTRERAGEDLFKGGGAQWDKRLKKCKNLKEHIKNVCEFLMLI